MELNRETLKKILWLIAFTVALYFLLSDLSVIPAFFGYLARIFFPFILGLCFAFVLNILLRPIERLYCRLSKGKDGFFARVKRPLCLLISTLLILGILSLLLMAIIPEIQKTAKTLLDTFPSYLQKIEGLWEKLTVFFADFSVVLPSFEVVQTHLTALVNDFFKKNGQSLVLGLFALLSNVVSILLGLVFCYYILARKERLGEAGRRYLAAFLPKRHAEAVIDFCALTYKTFSRFVVGQVTEAAILGVLCILGMLLFGLPYAPVIAALIGFTALIPVFGAFVGTAVGALLIFVVSPLKALWFILFILVLQQLEENLIYPRVVGRSVGLPSLWVLLAVTAGGAAFGIIGMLFAVPTVSVLYTTLQKTVKHRLAAKHRPNTESPP